MSTPAAEDLVLFEIAGNIARITLNRPEAAGAIAPEQRNRLIELFGRCDRDPEVRAVILRSTGKHFCSGADITRVGGAASSQITAASDGAPADPGGVGTGMDRILTGALRLISSILDCRKPVVCAVQGVAGGLGLHVALACDLIVAADTARFFEPLTLRGLVVDGAGGYLLPRRIGMQRAKELAFLGDKLPASVALDYGLVNRLVPLAELEAETEALAGRLARAATSAIGLTKRLLNESLDAGRAQAFLIEAMAVEMQSKAQDVTEGISAFRERREANFAGR